MYKFGNPIETFQVANAIPFRPGTCFVKDEGRISRLHPGGDFSGISSKSGEESCEWCHLYTPWAETYHVSVVRSAEKCLVDAVVYNDVPALERVMQCNTSCMFEGHWFFRVSFVSPHFTGVRPFFFPNVDCL